MSDPETGLLCMAYGSPRTVDDVEAYYTHIRGGRRPSPEALIELAARYRAVGGSPLEAITHRQADALGARLEMASFVGMKHAPPFISEGAAQAHATGVRRLVALPLAPHYAEMSLGGYERAVRESWVGDLVFVRGFHDHPAFVSAVTVILAEALGDFEPDRIFFTAHSLPERILREGDPYDRRLLDSCALVASAMALPPWEFAFQSASTTGEPWLGPDLLTAIETSGARKVLVCPIGFVADHLEILYDLDVEAAEFCSARGVQLRRTASFNDRPEFVEALASVVRDALAG